MFKDYAREPVPTNQGVSGWHIGLIYIGVGLALPAFLMAAQLGLALGLVDTLLATLLGGVILAVTGVFTGSIGAKVRLSTYMIAQITFGRAGAVLINALLACTLFGWFGVTITMFAGALDALFISQFSLNFGVIPWSIFGGILMVSTAIWGFKGLDKLSFVAVPVILLLLLFTNWHALGEISLPQVAALAGDGTLSFGVAVSMIVGGWMVGAAVMPDIARYGKNAVNAAGGAVLCFLPGLLAIICLSVIPALVTGEADVVKIMTGFGWPIMSTLVLLMAAWSSNDNNLYSASLSFSSIIPKVEKWKITLVAGAVGTLLSVLGVMDQFITFLIMLGVLIPPVAGVYIADFFAKRERYQNVNLPNLPKLRILSLTSWLLGCLLAFATLPESVGGFALIELTTISAFDGLLAGALVQFILMKLGK